MVHNTKLKKEITSVLSAHPELSERFARLLACLRLLGFTIVRADEAKMSVGAEDDLWSELSHPSVWIRSSSAPSLINKLRSSDPESAKHAKLTSQLIRANLHEQARLIGLLNEFYSHHTPASFMTRLIVETVDLGESYLRPQGASIRVIAGDDLQKRLYAESNAEVLAFAKFLATKLG